MIDLLLTAATTAAQGLGGPSEIWGHIVNDFSNITEPAAMAAFLQVLLIDLVLAGDNAIVVGALAAGLPADQRRKVIIIGVLAALVLLASARIKSPTPAIFITCSISLVSFCLLRIDSYSLRKCARSAAGFSLQQSCSQPIARTARRTKSQL